MGMPTRRDEKAIRDGLLGLGIGDAGLRTILASHMARHPDKDDYGLGRDGYTLDDPEEIRAFYEELGMRTCVAMKARVRSKRYKSTVGRVAREMAGCLGGEDSYLGRACCHMAVSELVAMTQASWLARMEEGFHLVSPLTPGRSQKAAWARSFSDLKRAFAGRPEYHAATAVFEYVITAPGRRASKADPSAKGKRPDVVLLTRTAAAVVEFKGYGLETAVAKGEIAECANYAKRIAARHIASRGLRVGAVLVLQGDRQLFARHGDVWCCSPDMICEAMVKTLGRHPKPHPDVEGWIGSDFEAR